MVEYLVMRIKTGALEYITVITQRPDLKNGIDAIMQAL